MKRLFLLLTVLTQLGCDHPAGTSAETSAAQAGPENLPHTGKVIEAIDVDAYTYLRLALDDGEIWIASNKIEAAKGDTVRFDDGALMQNFHSKTLNRTFDSIWFVNAIEASAAPSGKSDSGNHRPGQVVNPHHDTTSTAVSNIGNISLDPLEGGTTIAQIYSDRKQLEGKEVSLRVQVVKYSPDIMGKNWITLADGTGTPPDNTLIATSTWTASVGDVAVITGKIANDVDIGAGYSYKVLLQQAVFRK